MIYLDNNATTAALPAVVDAVVQMMTQCFSNPSSAHHRGGLGRKALRIAREQVSGLLGCHPEEIIFTSGGTEGNNTAIAAEAKLGKTIVYGSGDHASIIEPAHWHGPASVEIPMLTSGVIDIHALDDMLEETPNAFIATSWVNGETGVIQPVLEISNLAMKHGARLLLDAAQAIGRIDISSSEVVANYVTFSGHKIHGPQGTGALVARSGVPRPVSMLGGGQEGGLRAGTENLPGIVGLGVACVTRLREFQETVTAITELRDSFEIGLVHCLPEVEVNGTSDRVCNTSNLRFPGVDGQALLAQLDRVGICCSQASACSAQRPEPSRVLRAMGLDEAKAFESLRFSFSVTNSPAEIQVAVDAITAAVSRLRAFA